MLLAGLVLAAGQAPAEELVWRAGAPQPDLPEQVGPGYVRITIDSDGGTSGSLTVFRLREGATIAEFAEISDRIDQAFMEGGDVVAAFEEALALVDVVAEVTADADERRSVGVVLTEGRYALEYLPDEEGPRQRVYHELMVEGTPGAAAAPVPDATIQFVDFAFAIPPDLRAGEQTWHVINRGSQLHHMVIFSLADGATLEEFMEFMQQMETEGPPGADGENGEAIAAPYDYIGIASTGEESYHILDFEAGQYVAICFMPDHRGEATGQPHFMLGMVQVFRVGD